MQSLISDVTMLSPTTDPKLSATYRTLCSAVETVMPPSSAMLSASRGSDKTVFLISAELINIEAFYCAQGSTI